MTIQEMKKNVLKLIEEYSENENVLTSDIDISTKINGIMNHIQYELARYKKIAAMEELEVEKGTQMDTSELNLFYQLNKIVGVEHEIIDNLIIWKETGKAQIYYYKYPKMITEYSSPEQKIELSPDVLEIMPYGVAGDLLKSDVSNEYGVIYSNRYKEMLNMLDPRCTQGSIYIEGGC